MLGHDLQKQALERAYQSGRLGQAYFFHGPSGIGKKLFARELAKAVLCQEKKPGELTACDACPSCKLVEGETHPDLRVFFCPPEKQEFPRDLMLEIREGFFLKSSRGGTRVLILDDCDKFNEESGNLFLKTLEEPPGDSLIILLGSSVDLQLDTILSRCQKMAFYPLSDAMLGKALEMALPGESASLAGVLPFANGSPGMALAMKDPEFLKTMEVIISECLSSNPDPVRFNKCAMSFVESAGKESSLQRANATRLIHTALHWLRGLIAGSPSGEDEMVEKTLCRMEACFRVEEMVERRVQLALAVQYWVEEMLWPTVRITPGN